MKTITIDEFKALVALEDWHRTEDYEIMDRSYPRETDLSAESDVRHVWGCSSKTSTHDDVKIIYKEGFNYNEFDADSLSTGTEGQDEVWSIEGVLVLNEDWEEMGAHELADYLNADFSSIDYRVLDIDQVVEIDTEGGIGAETIKLDIDNEPSVRFPGEVIAKTASSEKTGRWTELFLYKTVGGKFICHQVSRTLWTGEREKFRGKVCSTLDEVREYFGYRWLAKELYDEAKIDYSINVE